MALDDVLGHSKHEPARLETLGRFLVDQRSAFAAEGELLRAGMQCLPRDQRSPDDLSAA